MSAATNSTLVSSEVERFCCDCVIRCSDASIPNTCDFGRIWARGSDGQPSPVPRSIIVDFSVSVMLAASDSTRLACSKCSLRV